MQSLYRVIKSAPVQEQDQVLALREISLTLVKHGEIKTVTPEDILQQANEQAKDILQQAEEQAAQLLHRSLAEAERKAQQIKEEARQAGWQEGIHASESEAEKIRDQARGVLQQAQEVYRKTLNKMESEIVDLAVDIAERVVMAQLSVEPQTVMQIAREAVEIVKNRPVVTIYVNDADLIILENGRVLLLQGLPPKVELHLLVDNAVQPGGCRIETDQGQVDATLETRWQEVIKALYGQGE